MYHPKMVKKQVYSFNWHGFWFKPKPSQQYFQKKETIV